MKRVIEMATELGVSTIAPISFQNTNFTLDSLESYQQIAISSAEQSERMTIPKICSLLSLKDLLSTFPPSTPESPFLFCRERSANSDSALDFTLRHRHGQSGALTSFAVLVGPEGGLREEECCSIQEVVGGIPLSLGPSVLRTETAVAASLSILMNLLLPADSTDTIVE
jgi:16S rRNA (uracil1498-N3)-methyltransferase